MTKEGIAREGDTREAGEESTGEGIPRDEVISDKERGEGREEKEAAAATEEEERTQSN